MSIMAAIMRVTYMRTLSSRLSATAAHVNCSIRSSTAKFHRPAFSLIFSKASSRAASLSSSSSLLSSSMLAVQSYGSLRCGVVVAVAEDVRIAVGSFNVFPESELLQLQFSLLGESGIVIVGPWIIFQLGQSGFQSFVTVTVGHDWEHR